MSTPKNNDRLYDIRTLDGFVATGKVKPSEVEKHLKSLPDEEGNYQTVILEEDDEAEA